MGISPEALIDFRPWKQSEQFFLVRAHGRDLGRNKVRLHYLLFAWKSDLFDPKSWKGWYYPLCGLVCKATVQPKLGFSSIFPAKTIPGLFNPGTCPQVSNSLAQGRWSLYQRNPAFTSGIGDEQKIRFHKYNRFYYFIHYHTFFPSGMCFLLRSFHVAASFWTNDYFRNVVWFWLTPPFPR